MNLTKILVGVDGSEQSDRAVATAVEFARRFEATVLVAHVLPFFVLPTELPPEQITQLENDRRAFGEQVLAHAQAKVTAANLRAGTVLLEGAPAEALSDLAAREDASMLVVGSRGRGAVARVLLGSTSDRLVHICARPVLVVH